MPPTPFLLDPEFESRFRSRDEPRQSAFVANSQAGCLSRGINSSKLSADEGIGPSGELFQNPP
jgi:hypothetical protein